MQIFFIWEIFKSKVSDSHCDSSETLNRRTDINHNTQLRVKDTGHAQNLYFEK